MQADSRLDWAGCERLGHLASRRERARRSRKGDEEGITLRVHLDPAMPRARLANQPPVLGERSRVALRAELVQQLGRALDVGEEKGDGSSRKIRAHNQNVSRLQPNPAIMNMCML